MIACSNGYVATQRAAVRLTSVKIQWRVIINIHVASFNCCKAPAASSRHNSCSDQVKVGCYMA